MRRALPDVQGCRERLGLAAVSQCETGHLAKARCYPKSMLAEWRLHVLGMLSLNKYRTLLTVAKAWVYSPGARAQAVSLLEALSCGAVLALARESFASPLLRDGGNVLLLEEQSTGDFALALNERLNNTDLLQKIRQGARETVVRNFAQDRVLPMQTRFLETCTGHERRRGHRVLAQSCKWRGTFM